MPRAIGDQKKCPTCGEVKHVSGFGQAGGSSDGLTNNCISCRKRQTRDTMIRTGRNLGGRKESQFTREEAEEIKHAYNLGGFSYVQLAEAYGVAQNTIRRVIKDQIQFYKGEALSREWS